MTRKNFSKATITARFKLCGGRCEWEENGIRCETMLRRGHWQCDHDDPDGLTGHPILENARCLCSYHHALKTKQDIRAIAKAKRVEAKHIGAKAEPARKIQSRGFCPKPAKDHPKIDKAALPALPRRVCGILVGE